MEFSIFDVRFSILVADADYRMTADRCSLGLYSPRLTSLARRDLGEGG